MSFKNFYITHKEKIDNELSIFLDRKIKDSKKISKKCGELLEVFKEFTLRKSKRIRILLVILGYQGYGGDKEKDIIKTALFVEFIHNYLLIHDDIIDHSDLRRGKTTVHKYFENTVKEKLSGKELKHFGVSMGILVGDIGCALGYETLLESKFSVELKLKAIKELNNLILKVIGGEALDVFAQISQNVSEEDIFKIYKNKTAYYSFQQPLRIGGILAGAGGKELKKIDGYAVPLGIAFQIQDDILGLFGDEKILGKPIDSDLKENKKTLILFKTLENCSDKDKKIIYSILGKENISLAEIDKIRDIVKKCGVLDFCQDLIKDYISKSKKAINNIDNFDKNVKFLLSDLADYLQKRKY
ncbi:polyprenyl synthetase family protein [Candidatus Parcubacteria bacterium]|nr:polyprenyl synthetase family protein [Candidatus Parcubacteria bacterium]